MHRQHVAKKKSTHTYGEEKMCRRLVSMMINNVGAQSTEPVFFGSPSRSLFGYLSLLVRFFWLYSHYYYYSASHSISVLTRYLVFFFSMFICIERWPQRDIITIKFKSNGHETLTYFYITIFAHAKLLRLHTDWAASSRRAVNFSATLWFTVFGGWARWLVPRNGHGEQRYWNFEYTRSKSLNLIRYARCTRQSLLILDAVWIRPIADVMRSLISCFEKCNIHTARLKTPAKHVSHFRYFFFVCRRRFVCISTRCFFQFLRLYKLFGVICYRSQ